MASAWSSDPRTPSFGPGATASSGRGIGPLRAEGARLAGCPDVERLPGQDRPGGRACHPAGLRRWRGVEGRRSLERRLYLARKRAERIASASSSGTRRPRISMSRACRAGRSATRACSWPGSCSRTIRTWRMSGSNRPWRLCTSGTARTRSRTGGWPSRSAASPTTARSTRSAATATRCGPASRRWPVPRFGEHINDLLPILVPGGSDSACFDNALELLVRAGRSMPHAMMMMIPEAFGAKYHISTDKRAFYEYHSSFMEPWDGPGGDALHRRPTPRRHAGPQRPASLPLPGDDRRLGDHRQRGGRGGVPAREDSRQGPAAAGTHVPGRYRRGPDHLRQRNQEQDRPPEAVPPLAGRESHRAARAVRCPEARQERLRRRLPSGCGPSAIPGKSSRWS